MPVWELGSVYQEPSPRRSGAGAIIATCAPSSSRSASRAWSRCARPRREERESYLEQAGYNLFLIEARHILIDLLTDSGTSAMSTEQWAAVMRGDESYAGSESFFRLKRAADELTGFRHMIPTHQGRAAERILFTVMCKPGHVVPSNTHFDTTRANIEFTGARAVDLPVPEAADTQAPHWISKAIWMWPRSKRLIAAEGAAQIPLVMLTVTNNSGGGQPVSMANIEAVKRVCGAPRHSAVPGRLPLRRKRLVHPRARARVRRLDAETDRAEDVFAGRRLHLLRQEGRLRQHRRASCAPTTTAWPSRRPTC